MAETRELSARECQGLLRSGVAGRVGAVDADRAAHRAGQLLRRGRRDHRPHLAVQPARDLRARHDVRLRDRRVRPGARRGWSVQARGRVEAVTDRAELELIREVAEPQPVGRWRPPALPAAALDRAQRPPDRRALGPAPTCRSRTLSRVSRTRAPDRLGGAAEALLEAVRAISSDLDLRSVLTRIVEAATQLTEARYGALGVIGADGSLVEFVTTGIDEETHRLIGDLPRGRGILGLLIHEPEGIRMAELAAHPASVGLPGAPPADGHLPRRTRADPGHRVRQPLPDREARRPQFTEQDEQLVEALARAAGFVIENARAYGLSERAASGWRRRRS